jgi:K+-transporting ATPase KdpF subunit
LRALCPQNTGGKDVGFFYGADLISLLRAVFEFGQITGRAEGELLMNLLYWIAGLITLALFVYLLAALLFPEKFE